MSTPYYMLLKDEFDLSYKNKKSSIKVEVELVYNRGEGLHVWNVTWLDSKNDLIAFTNLPWADQVFVINELDKKVKKHCRAYYEIAFAHFELGRN